MTEKGKTKKERIKTWKIKKGNNTKVKKETRDKNFYKEKEVRQGDERREAEGGNDKGRD